MKTLPAIFLLSLPFTLATAPLLVPAEVRSGDKPGVPSAKEIEFFENKIRPVLSTYCYECHSTNSKKARGGLLVDSREGMRKGGDSGPALVPGRAKDSLIVKALRHDGNTKMPPRSPKLGDDVIADFVSWIDMGAPDPREGKVVAAKAMDIEKGRTFWSFQPLAEVTPPAVKNQTWVRTAVDRFILAKLEASNLIPNQPISREHLIRRAYFDLHGLPPTSADVEAFVNDISANAYEKLIDRLLESERVGERWGRHWLDLVRFAESDILFDNVYDPYRPNAYHYRDFVIKAFNQNMPFDQFVRWQIAGDHLQPKNFQAVAATGFLVAGSSPQGTTKTADLVRYNQLDDMISTLGSSMLGLSVGCARCHAHKYDPIPQEDYYRLIACLRDTGSANVSVDPHPEGYGKAKADFDLVNATLLTARAKFEKVELPYRLQKFAENGKGKNPSWIVVDAVVPPSESPENSDKVDKTKTLTEIGKGKLYRIYELQAHTYLNDITGFRIDAPPGKKFRNCVASTRK